VHNKIYKLKLDNFRNYESATIKTEGADFIAISGDNGIGKTNILEAISLLSPGRGIRDCKITEMSYRKTPNAQAMNWTNYYEIGDKNNLNKIGTALASDNNNEGKRLIKINDNMVKSQSSLTDYCSIICLTPQMDHVFISGLSVRRKFLDKIATNFAHNYAKNITNYEQLVRSRMKLLKKNITNNDWLNALERQISELSVIIAASRIEAIEYLHQMFEYTKEDFPCPFLSIKGEIENMLNSKKSIEVEGFIITKLTNNREIDRLSGKTNFGIHRSDLIVYYLDKNMPIQLSSTGEQKIILIAITLAIARSYLHKYNKTPILLLDEVVAHLDEYKQKALFNELINLKAQTWLTAVHHEYFQKIPSNNILKLNPRSI
jgi:DNA replication and repair protein RecF